MASLSQVKNSLAQHKSVLFKKYPIKTLAIFGSYARNEQNENSDLDIMVEFKGKIGSRFIELGDELEHFLGHKVDLVSRNGVKEKYLKVIEPGLVYV